MQTYDLIAIDKSTFQHFESKNESFDLTLKKSIKSAKNVTLTLKWQKKN